MPQAKSYLEKVHIKNFLSFTDVEFPLKPLTILVGPNASGKSNALESLHLLNRTITHGALPALVVIRDTSPMNEADRVRFRFQAQIGQAETIYNLVLEAQTDGSSVNTESSMYDRATFPVRIVDEGLLVNGVNVISFQGGQLLLKDENGENETKFKSDTLALKSAGNYGNKPITRELAEFIEKWEFFDFRSKLESSSFTTPIVWSPRQHGFPNSHATHKDLQISSLSSLLLDWYESDRDRFDCVSERLQASTNFKIERRSVAGVNALTLEGHKSWSFLDTASDGTLRLMAYYTLLNRPELPPLIAIEEPERNLHPAALTEIANVLEQLAEQSQIIITTHSSQLLDVFTPEKLSDSIGVLLLRNPPERGTEFISLQDIRRNRVALDGWIADFGIGSAIFESELLQDLME